MAESVSKILLQVQEVKEIASRAVRQAGVTDTQITELSMAADHIGDVVKLIGAIAGQTNLLALNATIEAARASSNRPHLREFITGGEGARLSNSASCQRHR